MREGSLLEVSKFVVATILVLLVITVAAILLQATESSRTIEMQTDIVRSMTFQKDMPVPRHIQDATVYRFADGSAVVFLKYPLRESTLACAVQVNATNTVQAVRITSPLVFPASLRLENIAAHASSIGSSPSVSIFSPQDRNSYIAINALLKQAIELAKKAGTL